ncbi:DUF2065 domain-containing protein [Roseitranquillus sediminis]|uniref:DUF2065 domain-containing protein n=1 Tax=Roseitranquillus sediminis TaxID=2809051 RepID=UPI001D0CA77E|nr:DUF2065 domain-containing protein [Roseitranquillus sediminis]MBM9596453.1 DUF2065 domain-containing protein [Roseitranquillus sediminis]
MTAEILWAFGAVLCVEGLFLALAPGRLETLLELVARTTLDDRRLIGVAALAGGVGLLWLGRSLGA